MTNPENDHQVSIPPFVLDFSERCCITPDNVRHSLSAMEFTLLSELHEGFQATDDLAAQLTRRVQREQLEKGATWVGPISHDYVYEIISRIKEKIGSQYIESRTGHGYRITSPKP